MDEKEKQEVSSENDNRMFRDLTADDGRPEITEIESLCMNCEENGMTRLLLTRIPFFREVILASFSCGHCGYRNAELQPGSTIQDRGVAYTVVVNTVKDLNRQVVQTEHATMSIPELEFEIPPNKSSLTTIEGVIDSALEGLEAGQIIRRIQQPEVAADIEAFMEKLRGLKKMEQPFTIKLKDPSGNSFMENPLAPTRDPNMTIAHFARTLDEDHKLCIFTPEELATGDDDDNDGDPTTASSSTNLPPKAVGQDDGEGFNTTNEVLSFHTDCSNCSHPCETNMKLVNIPHFKEVVIMATVCDRCGHRDNEVKSSGGIEPKGRRHELLMKNKFDIARDLLKSETARLKIPELDFEMEMGTLGGKFTTVEGILMDVQKQLREVNPFFRGDSSQPDTNNRLAKFCDKLDLIMKAELIDVHVVLEDPAGNSYIQSLCTPDPDPQLKVTEFERTYEDNEELGLNDMKTENYS